jgi:hypothetical protein
MPLQIKRVVSLSIKAARLSEKSALNFALSRPRGL